VDWPYKTNLAFGVNLEEEGGRAHWKDQPVWKFRCEQTGDVEYTILREKGIELGMKYVLRGGIMPNMIPLEEFAKVGGKEIVNKNQQKLGLV
jgi:hypothetical protein